MESFLVKPNHSQATISVSIDSCRKEFPIISFMQVSKLKGIIYKMTGIPVSDQRLYKGHVELSNSRILEDYGLFEHDRKSIPIILEYKRMSGYFLRAVPGASFSKKMAETILSVNHGLRKNLAPQLTWDGTGGTYLMKDACKKFRGVFKPIDEEPFAPMNPRLMTGKLNSKGIRNGILSGQSAFREIAAFLLDHKNFSSVPETVLVESQHPTYKYDTQDNIMPKKGSFQQFVDNKGSIEDFSVKLFDILEVQKIAILDMRILNMDRNVANIIVTPEMELIPIDHGLSIPETMDISEFDLCWMDFPQCKELIDEKCLNYISTLDPLKDITFLRDTMEFSDTALMNIRVSGILLKKGAQAGLTLAQIGSILYRKEYEQTPSLIEQVIKKSIEFCKTITKSLSTRLVLEKNLFYKSNKRPRAYSNNDEMELMRIGDFETQTLTSTPEDSCEIFVTIKEVEEELEEETFNSDYNWRSLSLLNLVAFENSQIKKKVKKMAFDNKLFYYIEAFIDLAIEKKIRDINSKEYLEFMNPNGRLRSISDVNDLNDDFEFTLYK